jgi:hypothetical protein
MTATLSARRRLLRRAVPRARECCREAIETNYALTIINSENSGLGQCERDD